MLQYKARQAMAADMTKIIETADSIMEAADENPNEIIDENSALHNAALRGHTNYLEALLQAGASVNSRDQYGNTLLHLAAMRGHMKSVQLLLDRGAKLNARNKYGNTCLHLAALNGHTDMVLFLVDKGLKVSDQNYAGSIPLTYAGMIITSLLPLRVISEIKMLRRNKNFLNPYIISRRHYHQFMHFLWLITVPSHIISNIY